MDSTTGVIVWDKPQVNGLYSIVYKVSKYRNSQFLCSVTRDMLIFVYPPALGINEISIGEEKLNIYPNPANNKLNITLTDPSPKTTAQITTLTGQVVMQNIKITSSNLEVEASALAAGMYLLMVQDEKGSYVRKFVKE